MSVPLRCYECGRFLGPYTQFIDKARTALVRKQVYANETKTSDYVPSKVAFDSTITPEMGSVYNLLGINNICCRTHLTSRTDLDRLYK